MTACQEIEYRLAMRLTEFGDTKQPLYVRRALFEDAYWEMVLMAAEAQLPVPSLIVPESYVLYGVEIRPARLALLHNTYGNLAESNADFWKNVERYCPQ